MLIIFMSYTYLNCESYYEKPNKKYFKVRHRDCKQRVSTPRSMLNNKVQA